LREERTDMNSEFVTDDELRYLPGDRRLACLAALGSRSARMPG
jgi:hypothetical protein